MNYKFEAHRHADIILKQGRFAPFYEEVTTVIENISDEDIRSCHEEHFADSVSISKAINRLLKDRLVENEWCAESPIFQDNHYNGLRWRLDFAKDLISIEVAFNHGEAIAWNLLKPVLASELNHVEKAIQTEVGIMVCATRELKETGNFDSSVGEYEKVCRYLRPLRDLLTAPMLIIGLEAPETFRVERDDEGNGIIVDID